MLNRFVKHSVLGIALVFLVACGGGGSSSTGGGSTLLDTTAPVITLRGSANVTVSAGTRYTDAGASASDDTDGDITAHIVTDNPVDINTAGTYMVTYDVNDTAGNSATQVTRTVFILSDDIPIKRQYGIFKVLEDNVSIEMNGEINSQSLKNYNDLKKSFPNIKTINIIECSGSSDDEINLLLSRKVHDDDINTHIVDNGLVASGGTDFFLAGNIRTVGTNTKIGVHSWASEDENGNITEGADLPDEDPQHLEYINYYRSIGFTEEEAKAFYFFTLDSASSDDMHYMTEDEIDEYRIFNTSIVPDTTAPIITLTGSATVIVEAGTSYADAGASASDDIDGNITDKITTTGSVDTSKVGLYTITYTATDSKNNTVSTKRYVSVVDITKKGQALNIHQPPLRIQ